MKQSRKTIALLAAVLVLVILLLFANRNMTRQSPQAVGDTVTPAVSLSPTLAPPFGLPTIEVKLPSPIPSDYPTHVAETLTARPPTITPTPTATSTLAPPACTFPLAGTTAEESKPENYIFSEPQVVLTEYQPSIVDWLPDNQNVLIMPVKLADAKTNEYQQVLELFNPETKETRIYAMRTAIGEALPAWNSTLNAVVYPVRHFIEGKTFADDKFIPQLWISYGNPDEVQLLADNLPQYSMAVKPDGSQMAYFIGKQLFKMDDRLNALPPISFDRTRWDYQHHYAGDNSVVYKMAWRPNSVQIFLYNYAIYDGLGYTYILDSNTGQLCNLNLDGWALAARWSPNGRYLAIIRGQDVFPLRSTDLAVIDATTGKLYILTPPQIESGHYVRDIEWAPDNRHILTTYAFNEQTNGMLFLNDVASGQIIRVLPSFRFSTGALEENLAWSPDGSKILMNCATGSPDGGQECLISVQKIGK
jgi:WD40 repeat protein